MEKWLKIEDFGPPNGQIFTKWLFLWFFDHF